MTVRALFQLVAIKEHFTGSKTLTFGAEYDNTIEEHRRFQKATPYGQFEMTVDNPAALEQFHLGKYYYFDVSPRPE